MSDNPAEVKIPKKRGRKPKNVQPSTVTESPPQVVEKKKRGRKPKPKPATIEVKIPKKRGRKPLDSYKNLDVTKQTNVIKEENIILHLPIKSSELKNENIESTLFNYNPELLVPKPFSDDLLYQEFSDISKSSDIENNLNKSNTLEIINNEDINTNNLDNMNNNLENNTNIQENMNYEFNNTNSENLECINNNLEDNITQINNVNTNEDICEKKSKESNTDVLKSYEKIKKNYNNSFTTYEKNKVLPILLEYNQYNKNKEWPNSVNINCFWCCEKFNSVPVGIPMKKLDNTYYMYGNFCSPECAAAYIFDDKKFINDCWDKYSMLNYLYSDGTPIKIAPPRLCLKSFGGRLNIEEFRNMCTKFNKSYKLLLPPMISLLPMIEEINLNDGNSNIDMFLLNKDQINKANEEYRLKRNKPLPDSKNTLESCMNLKIL